MVCSKCQKAQKKTELATPGVKRKNDMYYGSPTMGLNDKKTKSATLGETGIGKVSRAFSSAVCHFDTDMCIFEE